MILSPVFVSFVVYILVLSFYFSSRIRKASLSPRLGLVGRNASSSAVAKRVRWLGLDLSRII